MIQVVSLARTPSVFVRRLGHPAGERHVDPEEEASPDFSVNVVEAGGFRLHSGAGDADLVEGDVFLTLPGAPVRYRHSEEVPADTCLSISFSADALEGPEGAGRARRPAIVRGPSNRLRYLCARIPPHAGTTPPPESLAVDSRAQELLEAVLGAAETPPRRYGTRQLRWYEERVDAARETLETRFDDAPPLETLARGVGMSPFHFARIFRELTGSSPHRYLVRVRLARAQALLEDGARVTEACHASGFGNLSHFVRSYRRHFGTKPSRARGSKRSKG